MINTADDAASFQVFIFSCLIYENFYLIPKISHPLSVYFCPKTWLIKKTPELTWKWIMKWSESNIYEWNWSFIKLMAWPRMRVKWNMMLREKCRIRYNSQWRSWLECWFLNSHMTRQACKMYKFFKSKPCRWWRRYMSIVLEWLHGWLWNWISAWNSETVFCRSVCTRFPFVSIEQTVDIMWNVIIECFPICFCVPIIILSSSSCSFIRLLFCHFTAWP